VIKEIQGLTGRRLLVYEVKIWSDGCDLNEEDIQPFSDLLEKVRKNEDVNLLLHSPGGQIDAAEKIIYMCRVIAGSLRVIVPEYAKSAATLIALASDEVVMGLASELGPVDAQLSGPGPGGGRFQTSAQCFIDEFERIKREVKRTGNLSPVYYPILQDMPLGFIEMCRNLMARSREFATKWLKKYMLKGNPVGAKKLAAELCNVRKWRAHGVVIDADQALKLGIKVSKLNKDDALWKAIWYLHCCYGVLFRNTNIVKVFESDSVSLLFQA